MAVADDALAVDDDDGAAAVAFVFAPEAIGLGHLPLGVEVSQEGEINAAELVGKSSLGMDTVNAEAQDLGL